MLLVTHLLAELLQHRGYFLAASSPAVTDTTSVQSITVDEQTAISHVTEEPRNTGAPLAVLYETVAPADSGETRWFSPPLYVQRYFWAYHFVNGDSTIQRVADFGCAELSLFRYLIASQHLRSYTAVDLDGALLCSSAHRVKPHSWHYLDKRDAGDLSVTVLAGDLCHFDPRLADLDCIIMLELIEHVPVDVVPLLIANIFGRLRPRYVIMSTPNSDYNVVFDKNWTGFRHWDHRFEWTRSEFAVVCADIDTKYGYDVEITGVGAPPADRDVGFCSQAAIFTRRENFLPSENIVFAADPDTAPPHFEIIHESVFPGDNRSPAERKEMTVRSAVNALARCWDECESGIPCSISALQRRNDVRDLFSSRSELLEYLSSLDYHVVEDEVFLAVTSEWSGDEEVGSGDHWEDESSVAVTSGVEESWD